MVSTNPRCPKRLPSFPVVCAFLALFCQAVAANTEIINFLSEQQRTVDLPRPVVGNWVTLDFSHNEHQWALQPAPLGTPLHEVWVALDLDDADWTIYRAFTLRLSWPASVPAEFLIEIYSPESLSALLSQRGSKADSGPPPPGRISMTRTKYARIRVVDAGVPTPQIHPGLSNLVVAGPVPFILILEQLYWGVLPASLLPTICFLVPVLLAAAMTIPPIVAYLDSFVRQAREDLKSKASSEKKGQ